MYAQKVNALLLSKYHNSEKNIFRKKYVCRFILLIALLCLAKASWISTKASLAQILIAYAWKTTLSTGTNTKPWQWADTWPIAILITPSGDKLYVLQTTSGQALAFGPGLLDQSTPPGQIGNTVIAGHRDTHFMFLEHTAIGDIIQLQNAQGITYRYQIKATEIVNSRTEKVQLQKESAELTLITCYPFHALNSRGPLRYVVHAALI
jgi:sortase A